MSILQKILPITLFIFSLFLLGSIFAPPANAFTVFACYGTPYKADGSPTFYPAGSDNCFAGEGTTVVSITDFSPSTIIYGQTSTISGYAQQADWCDGVPGSIWTGRVGNDPDGDNAIQISAITLTTLAPGTYTQAIQCGGAVADNPPPTSATKTLIVKPASPSLSITPGSCGSGTLNASWSTSVGATSYVLENWQPPSTWVTKATINPPTTSYSITGLTAGSPYSYRIKVTSAGGSVYSNVVDTNAPSACASGYFTQSPSCEIPIDGVGCSGTAAWTTSGTNFVKLTNCAGGQITNAPGGDASSGGVYVPYNTGCYQIRLSDDTVLAQTNGTATCITGSAWNGSKCAASAVPVNGACGNAAKNYSSSATSYSTAFCNPGTPSPASPAFPAQGGSSTWTCLGANGGTNSPPCLATRDSAITYSCTGTIPANAGAYDAEESSSLTSSIAWTYAGTDTATKCQYHCTSGTWDGSSCAVVADTCTGTADVTVTGSTSGGSVWGTDIYTDDSDVGKAAVHAGILTPGQSATIRKTFSGTRSNFIGSTRNGVTTADYASNWCSMTLSLVGANGADLTAGGITDSSGAQVTATEGQSVRLYTRISNIGNQVTGGSQGGAFQVRYEQATDINGTNAQVMPSTYYIHMTPLSAGSSINIFGSATFASGGTKYVRACADDGNLVPESNEVNNCGAWTAVAVSASAPSVTGNITSTSCEIPANGSTCASTVTWSTENASNVSVQTSTTTISSGQANNATGIAYSVSYGSTRFSLYNGGTLLDSELITASCPANHAWVGGMCVSTLVPPTLTVSKSPVKAGNSVTLSWDTNNGDETSCSLNGKGVSDATLDAGGGGTNETGSVNVVISGRTTFMLTCGGLTSIKTVEIVPSSWES